MVSVGAYDRLSTNNVSAWGKNRRELSTHHLLDSCSYDEDSRIGHRTRAPCHVPSHRDTSPGHSRTPWGVASGHQGPSCTRHDSSVEEAGFASANGGVGRCTPLEKETEVKKEKSEGGEERERD